MLTIQPKFTHYSNTRQIAFRGEDPSNEDKIYEEKQKHYAKQVEELDELIQDKHTNKTFKKVLKGSKVVSEGLLEGWAVAWGAHKGAKIVKPSILVKGADSKLYKVLSPMFSGIKKGGAKFIEVLSKGVDNVKASKLYTGAAEKLAAITEKLNNHSVGKYVVKAFEYIGKAFKYVGGLVKKGFEAIAKPFKGKTGEELYDKAAKVTSNTMGVGAGAAGAYDAATKDSKKTPNADNSEQDEKLVAVKIENIDDIDDKEDVINNDNNELNEVEKMLEDGE